MRVEVVAVENWMSHVASELTPNGAGFLTIRGDHGVGKTALVEAIGYALFGRGRFDTADEPVRIGATDMSVRVEWLAPDGQRYRAIRRRTTKSGGKASLNFAVQRADSSWTSLDGDGIKATEVRIREVVGVDGPTFEAIAFLMQGRITALVEATSAGRRDVLVGGLLLDVWSRAAVRARKDATVLEANLAVRRDSLARAEQQLESLPDIEAELVTVQGGLATAEAGVSESTAERDRLQSRVVELEASLADSKRAEDDLVRVKAEHATVADAWHRARDRGEAARAQVARLTGLLQGTDEANAAAAAVPGAKAALEVLVAGEAEERRLAAEIQAAHRAILDLERPHEAAVTTWRVQHDAAVARVAELEAHAKAGTMTCTACGQPIGQDTAREQLTAARATRDALGEQPTAPISIARAEATKARLEMRYDELGWDPATLVAARDELARLERLADKAEELARIGEQLERETAAAADADAERVRITERGQAITAEIASLEATIAGADQFRAERRAAGDELGRAIATLELAQAAVRQAERAIAMAEATLEQLRALQADAERDRAELVQGAEEATRLRRLVAAFGEIPLRIIDASLPELEAEAQALLDMLDPGATVAITAQRATVDGKRIVSAIDITYTDGAGARDVRMTSGGERVAVSVALSLGLRRVLARRHGARLDTAAIDEPDGLDAAQRRALAVAIRGLVHSGDLARAWLITHHEDLAEAGDAQVVVSKNGHGSVLESVL